jgi:hypothetical protein
LDFTFQQDIDNDRHRLGGKSFPENILVIVDHGIMHSGRYWLRADTVLAERERRLDVQRENVDRMRAEDKL